MPCHARPPPVSSLRGVRRGAQWPRGCCCCRVPTTTMLQGYIILHYHPLMAGADHYDVAGFCEDDHPNWLQTAAALRALLAQDAHSPFVVAGSVTVDEGAALCARSPPPTAAATTLARIRAGDAELERECRAEPVHAAALCRGARPRELSPRRPLPRAAPRPLSCHASDLRVCLSHRNPRAAQACVAGPRGPAPSWTRRRAPSWRGTRRRRVASDGLLPSAVVNASEKKSYEMS